MLTLLSAKGIDLEPAGETGLLRIDLTATREGCRL